MISEIDRWKLLITWPRGISSARSFPEKKITCDKQKKLPQKYTMKKFLTYFDID